MASRTLYTQIETEKSLVEVKEAVKTAFRSVGGSIQESSTGMLIKQGVNGVSFAFTADVAAQINVRQVKENRFEVECLINWSMNALSWICLVVGIFIFGILWIVPLLYLFVKPDEAYQQALNRIYTYL